MKQTELKSALGKIRAREELIASTMERLETQREQKSRVSFASGKGLRLASLVMVCVLFLGVGVLLGRQMPGPTADTGLPDTHGVSPLHLTPSDTVFSGTPLPTAREQDLEDELILASGNGHWMIGEGEVTESVAYTASSADAEFASFFLLTVRLTEKIASSGVKAAAGDTVRVLYCTDDAETAPGVGGMYRFYLLTNPDMGAAFRESLTVYRFFGLKN